MSNTVEMKNDGLLKLIKAFKGNLPVARVGILGDSNARTQAPAELTHESLMRRAVDKPGKPVKKKEAWTNAQIGARWEFDQKTKRSFLRVPLMDNLNVRLNKAGAFKPEVLEEVVKSGTLLPYVNKIAQVGRDIVLGGFETCGYGKWQPSNMKRKKVKMTLVETQQLLRSITEDVK